MKLIIRRALLGLLAFALAWTSAAAGKQPYVVGGKLDFELPDLRGNMISSAGPRFTGKVLFVDLWATWCTPCLTEIPTLIELQEQYGERGLVIVAIAFEAEEEAKKRRTRLQEFVAERGINYLVLDGGTPDEFKSALPAVQNVRGFPVEIFVNRDGKVVAARNGYGYKKKWVRKLQREIQALLDESATP